MTNYLYNGIELPALPEWDRETYPYAVITKSGFSSTVTYTVTFYRELFVVHDAYYSDDNWSLLVNSSDYLTATIKTKSGVLQSENWTDLTTETDNSSLTADNNGTDVPYTKRLCNYDSDYIFWSNHSFPGPNGEEWITASDPIPVNPAPTLDPTVLLMYWQVGRKIASQRRNNKTPVAYLYNDIRLPKLPEWDRETYPYACIGTVYRFDVGSVYQLYYSESPMSNRMTVKKPYIMYEYSNGEWVQTYNAMGVVMFEDKAIWVNHNVDGLIATEPIPVYE